MGEECAVSFFYLQCSSDENDIPDTLNTLGKKLFDARGSFLFRANESFVGMIFAKTVAKSRLNLALEESRQL